LRRNARTRGGVELDARDQWKIENKYHDIINICCDYRVITVRHYAKHVHGAIFAAERRGVTSIRADITRAQVEADTLYR